MTKRNENTARRICAVQRFDRFLAERKPRRPMRPKPALSMCLMGIGKPSITILRKSYAVCFWEKWTKASGGQSFLFAECNFPNKVVLPHTRQLKRGKAMDAVLNTLSPSAGSPPPELIGRSELIDTLSRYGMALT